MREHRGGAPVFVKVEDYKEILDVLDLIKAKVSEIRHTLGEINTLREQENSELEMWNGAIDDIEKKIENIDKAMFEPEQNW